MKTRKETRKSVTPFDKFNRDDRGTTRLEIGLGPTSAISSKSLRESKNSGVNTVMERSERVRYEYAP